VLLAALAGAAAWLASSVGAASQVEPLPPGVTVQTVAAYAGDQFPVAMAFTPDGRLLFTEKGGFDSSPHAAHVRVVENGALRPQPWVTVTVVANSERGLLGIAVDPDFATNGYVYVFYTRPGSPQPVNRVSRFTEVGGFGVNEMLLLDIPEVDAEPNHNGGNLHFGPDGKLYVSVGESGSTRERAQDLTQAHGKILRINKEDGSAPADNPFYDGPGPNDDRIWSLGHRNPFDFDFDSISRQVFAIDNGPQCNDEINRVLPGGNYGWPFDADYDHGTPCPYTGNPAYTPPLYYWPSTIAPAGIVVYDGDDVAEWYGDLLVCASNDSSLYHARLSPGRDAIAGVDRVQLPNGVYCGTDVEVAPDGSIYLLAWVGDTNYVFRLSGPANLRLSHKSIAPPNPQPGETATYTIDLINSGGANTTFTLTDTFPAATTLIAGSPTVTSGALISTSQGLTWTGTISANFGLQLVFQTTVSAAIVSPTLVSNVAVVSGAGASYPLASHVLILGQRVYLPLVLKAAFP
jgi:uncharacterized repeat protein (TIGR01451 family)